MLVTKIHIVKDEIEASRAENQRTFKSLYPLGNGLYEVESTPNKIVFDLPIIIGIQILQLAKIRLLEVKYDFLDYYSIHGWYSTVLCDTDSLYIL